MVNTKHPRGALLSIHTCAATRSDGGSCGAPPGNGGLCFWHDPASRDEMLKCLQKRGKPEDSPAAHGEAPGGTRVAQFANRHPRGHA